MRKYLLACAAALAIASATFVAAQPSFAAELTNVPEEKAELIFKSDRPVLLLVYSKSSAAGAAEDELLAKHAPGHQDLKVFKIVVDGDQPQQPSMMMVVPPMKGPIWSAHNVVLTEENVDAFLNERAAVAAKEVALFKQIADLKHQREVAIAPLEKQLDRLRAQAQLAIKHDERRIARLNARREVVRLRYVAQLHAIMAKVKAARQPFIADEASLDAQIEAKKKPFWVQIDAAQKDRDAALAHFEDDYAQLQKAENDATRDLYAELRLADANGDRAKVAELRAKMDQVAAPFVDQFKELGRKVNEAAKPFEDRITHLMGEMQMATYDLEQQSAALREKADAASSPIYDQTKPIYAKGDAALKPYDVRKEAIYRHEKKLLEPLETRAYAIASRKQKLSKPFDKAIALATAQLENIAEADQPK
jgi:hypothetical protein